MSISATLSNALTGLSAASRGAQVISSNVANANTQGYARREIELSARVVGGAGAGVQVDGINRVVDETILRERRLAQASVGDASVTAEFYTNLLDIVGLPDDANSLSANVINLESAFLEASFRPESEARLYAVLSAAEAVTTKFNSVSNNIQTLRSDADTRIAAEVETLNASLSQIADLNEQILVSKGSNLDYPGLLDQRQRLIDQISQLVPIRQLSRDNDTVALYSMGGALLVDTQPAVFGFEATAPITADMTLASGALSGLTINGENVRTTGPYAPIAGGVLAGLFETRDDLAIGAQANIDEIARDLITRFENPTLDPTLNIGDAGLFTDEGTILDPLDLVGLSSRLSVNTLVDPSQAGEIWRIRDGIGAIAPGPVGNTELLTGSVEIMSALQAPNGGNFGAASRSASDFVAGFSSLIGRTVQSQDNRLAFETARLTSLQNVELSNGVDTDQELQKLLLIEQSYAANARVIQVADELIQLLIGL